MKYQVLAIPKEKVQGIFPFVSEYIADAINQGHNETSLGDIYKQILQCQKQLWIISDEKFQVHGAVVTEIADYPQKRVIRILFLGGNGLEEWAEAVTNTLEAWAKVVKASTIEIIGRKGWERFLRKFDYQYAYAYLIKEI